MNKSAYLLAEVAVEVAEYLPECEWNIPRAEWRHMIVDKAIKIIDKEFIDDATEDIDEIVQGYLRKEGTYHE